MWFKWFFYFSLWQPFCSAERNHFSNFSRESSKEHFCEIILKSANWPGRRCRLKGFSIFSFDGHFIQRSGTILAILVEGHPRNISVKLFWNRPIGLGEDVVLLVFSIFSSGGHFVQQSRTILAILVKGHPRNIPVKLFWNPPIGLGGDVV